MSWREYHDAQIAAGSYPNDDDTGTEDTPSEIVVNVLIDELCRDVDTGVESTEVVRSYRVYPLFMSKAAFRMAAYLGRKHGKHNVWVEYY